MDWQFSFDTTRSPAPAIEVSEEHRQLLTRVHTCALKLNSVKVSDVEAWTCLVSDLKLGIEQGISISILEEASGLRSPTLERLASGELQIKDVLPDSAIE